MERDIEFKTGSRIIVRPKTGAKRTGEHGFTLLETAIALVVNDGYVSCRSLTFCICDQI